MQARAYVLIQAEKGQSGSVAAELDGKPGIMAVDRVFGHVDLVAMIEAADIKGLVRIVRNEIAPSEHVVRTETLIITVE